MRLAFNNLIDDLNASTLSALSETTGYEVTQVQDQRLTTTWKSSSATSQTVLATLPTLPEYPDNATGTTYFQDAWATTDGWTAVNCSITAINGLIVSSNNTSINQYIQKTFASIPTGTTVMFKVRRVSGVATTCGLGGVMSSLTEFAFDSFGVAVASFTTTSASTTPIIYPVYGGRQLGDLWSIDWIYIGNGNYTTQLIDLSGNANHATIYGATPVDTPYGRGLSFDGTNDYVSFGDVVKTSGAITVSHWVKRTGTMDAVLAMTIGKWTTASANRSYALATHATLANRLRFIISMDGTNIEFVNDTTDLQINTWTHVAGVFVPGVGLYFFRDGIQVGFTAYAGTSIYNGTATLRMNSGLVGTNYYAFEIAQTKIYNRALNATEILNLYNQTAFTTENDGLAGYWDVDHGLGVDTVAIGGHNLKTGTQVKIQASNTNEWSNPEVNETLTVNPDLIVKFLSSKKFYKYWRFLFGSQGDLEIGRLWLGEYLQISPSSLNGFSVVKKRSDNVIHGKNRQKWAVPGIGWRRFELSFPRTAEAMIYQLSQMYDDVGNHSSLIFCNFDDLVNYELVRPCYVSIDGEVGFTHTKRQQYEWSLNLEEEK